MKEAVEYYSQEEINSINLSLNHSMFFLMCEKLNVQCSRHSKVQKINKIALSNTTKDCITKRGIV